MRSLRNCSSCDSIGPDPRTDDQYPKLESFPHRLGSHFFGKSTREFQEDLPTSDETECGESNHQQNVVEFGGAGVIQEITERRDESIHGIRSQDELCPARKLVLNHIS